MVRRRTHVFTFARLPRPRPQLAARQQAATARRRGGEQNAAVRIEALTGITSLAGVRRIFAAQAMLQVRFDRIVGFCIRRWWLIVLASALIVVGAADYVAENFAINTDINNLLSPNLAWRKRELAYLAASPEQATSILAVVTAPTPEFAGAAAAILANRLSSQSKLFRSVTAVEGGEFFQRNGLLYLSRDRLSGRLRKLSDAAPLIRMLASDPSLRGLSHALSASLQGVRAGRYSLDAMAPPLNAIADTIEKIRAGHSASFYWQALVNGAPANPEDLRHVIVIWPVLDYRALEPGRGATEAINKTFADAGLMPSYDASLRLTGTVPLADQQFASLRQGVWLNALITAATVVIVLWLALRSLRILLAVIVTIVVGLLATAALGLLLVGAFNPISVAFAVLFVGLGADFAIQFSVRYRAQRRESNDLKLSLIDAARLVGAPLTLAAAAAAAGFLAFGPTSYRGIAELGLIAGCGMVVAYIASMTLLPVLLWLFKAPPEPRPLGYSAMALTRAVFFSALMTATAFGSLWFSAHPGISSMGKLLALSLACTLASAALFQPALMGPPRETKT
jgi:uncharacterized protein